MSLCLLMCLVTFGCVQDIIPIKSFIEIIHIYLQTRGLFPSARRLRALAICDHLPAFRGRARLRPSCSGSFLHPSRTPVSFQPNASHPHRTPLSCLSLDSNPQLRWSGGGALRIAAQPLGRPLWDERTPPGEKQL